MHKKELPPEVKEMRPIPKHIYHYLTMPDVGPRTQSELIEELDYTRDSVWRALSELAEAGLIEKQRDMADGRRRPYAPTNEQ